MSRIRTIKPEFWTSEQVAECSANARLLFIGMWNFCDDGGNHPFSIKRLKMEIFPGDNLSNKDVESLVKELLDNKLICVYVVENSKYIHVLGWHHQRIDKPSFKYPQFNKSNIIRITFCEHSDNGSMRKGREGKGREGIVMEGNVSNTISTDLKEVIIYKLQLNDNSQHEITENDFNNYVRLYPAVDIIPEFRKMDGWIISNPNKRKTKKGIKRFINSWLSRQQDSYKSKNNDNFIKNKNSTDQFWDNIREIEEE